MEIIRSYDLDNREDMISLAKDIQTKVYWGGSFILDIEEPDTEFRWKDFWDIVGVETEGRKDIVGISIQENPCIVRFLYAT